MKKIFVAFFAAVVSLTSMGQTPTQDTTSKAPADTTVQREIEVEQVAVRATRRGNYINNRSMSKTEVVNKLGLQKMACCSAAESFENSASVTVGSSDGVTGTKQIRMLGLNGIYTSLMNEGRVISRSMSAPYALNFMPGPWLSGVHISKGIATVAAGPEALTGHINMLTKDPTTKEPLFINAYIDSELRTELNITSSLQINENLSTAIFAHGSIEPLGYDHNHDGFLDTPKGGLMAFGNNWQYVAPYSGIEIRGGVKYVGDKRMGGQMNFDHNAPRSYSTDGLYGSQIENQQVNAYFKLAVPTDDKGSNFALTADYNYFFQKAYYGLKDYFGRQNSAFLDAKYFMHFSEAHNLLVGISGTFDYIGEGLQDRFVSNGDVLHNSWNLNRNDKMGGVFAEYTYSLHDKLSVIGGLRLDYANFYGWYVTPRAHVRWSITPRTTLRVSGGLGYRAASIISDNLGVLATGRQIQIADNLDRMERGASVGGSITQTFKLAGDNNASVSVDVFHTAFQNQVIADQEYASNKVFFYNLGAGNSQATAYQIDFNWQPIERFDILLTFRYNDTRVKLRTEQSTEEVSRIKPLIDQFKGLINLQYATKFRKWVFDFTAQVNGQTRLPGTVVEQAGMDFSPVYPMLFAQITKSFKQWDIYLGCENILDYRQQNPVLSAENPFSENFNASIVWGPLMGRKIYLGVRFKLL